MTGASDTFAVIMAGGLGTRFWPESRRARPKQLLDLMGTGKNLLRLTFERAAALVAVENILVVTGEAIGANVVSCLPEVLPDNLLLEPVGRNTAPCIGWAANRIRHRRQSAVMVVLPSDHYVGDEVELRRVITLAVARARACNSMVTVGIKPTRPETGYGYIESGEAVEGEVRKVVRFVEKPSRETALEYLRKGNFFWNAGIFVFTAERILEEIKKNLPDIASVLSIMQAAFEHGGSEEESREARRVFPTMRGISIDYGVMERASGLEVIPSDCGWSDLGSWSALYEKLPHLDEENAVRGGARLVALRSRGCLASSSTAGKVVALVGVEGLVVVDTQDALLVCSMKEDQEVKEIVARLSED